MAPLSETNIHLHFLSVINRLFLNKNFKDKVMVIKNKKTLCEFFKQYFYEH
jgi:mannitol/fructose-specific phosphotransferase system IIA component (Ntr-type)